MVRFFENTHILYRKEFEAKLSRMASQGYFLKPVKKIFHRYHKAEPEDLDFRVIFQELPFPPDNSRDDFIAECQKKGWDHVLSYPKYIIFRKRKGEEIPEIIDDPKEEYDGVKKKVMIGTAINMVIAVVLLVLFIALFVRDTSFYRMASGYSDFPSLFLIFIFLVNMNYFIHGTWFIFKNRKRAVEGKELIYPKSNIFITSDILPLAMINLVLWDYYRHSGMPILAIALFLMTFIAIVTAVNFIWNKKNIMLYRYESFIDISRIAAIILLFIVLFASANSMDFRTGYEVPKEALRLSDFGIQSETEIFISSKGSNILIKDYITYSEDINLKDETFPDRIRVEIREARADWIAKKFISGQISFNDSNAALSVTEVTSDYLGADRAYYLQSDKKIGRAHV